MPVTETEWELLEQYLDRELEPAEARRLELRLPADPALAAALDELRQQRQAVGSFLGSLEDDAAAERVTRAVSASIQRRQRLHLLARTTRWGSAIAACLAIGLIGLYAGKALFQKPTNGTPIVTGNSGMNSAAVYTVVLRDPASNDIVAVQECRSAEEAKRIATEINAYQEKLTQARDGEAVPVASRF